MGLCCFFFPAVVLKCTQYSFVALKRGLFGARAQGQAIAPCSVTYNWKKHKGKMKQYVEIDLEQVRASEINQANTKEMLLGQGILTMWLLLDVFRHRIPVPGTPRGKNVVACMRDFGGDADQRKLWPANYFRWPWTDTACGIPL